MADNVYGPVIPPHFLPRKREGSIDEKESEITSKPKRLCTDGDNDGVKHLMPSAYGPMLPEHLMGREDNEDISNEDSDNDDVSFGPKLPPDMIQSNSSVTSPTVDNDDDDGEVIGPMLPSDGSTSTDNFPHLAHEIDSRSRQMKDKLTNKGSGLVKPSREEWMMELPPEIQVHALGLGPRKFKTKYTEVGDRSVWTRMPGEMPPKDNKKKTSSEESVSSVRDQKLAEEVEEYNKSYRSESLLEIHKKKRAEKGQGQTNERRPFDRDIDLAMPQKIITSSKRTSLIKDSQKSLSSKFARGKTSFL